MTLRDALQICFKLNLRLADNLSDWSGYVRDLFKVRATFTDLGLHRGGRLKGRWAL